VKISDAEGTPWDEGFVTLLLRRFHLWKGSLIFETTLPGIPAGSTVLWLPVYLCRDSFPVREPTVPVPDLGRLSRKPGVFPVVTRAPGVRSLRRPAVEAGLIGTAFALIFDDIEE